MTRSTLAKPKADLATHAALFVVQVAFASQSVEAKVAMMPRASGGEAIPPVAIAMARMLAGALFFQVFVNTVAKPKEPREALTPRDHATLFALSLLGITANQAIFLLGLGKTTPFAAALLSATIPVCTSLLAALFGVERLRARTVMGFSLAVAGVLVLTGVRTVDRGALLIAVNSLLYSGYLVAGKSTISRLGALRAAQQELAAPVPAVPLDQRPPVGGAHRGRPARRRWRRHDLPDRRQLHELSLAGPRVEPSRGREADALRR